MGVIFLALIFCASYKSSLQKKTQKTHNQFKVENVNCTAQSQASPVERLICTLLVHDLIVFEENILIGFTQRYSPLRL